MRFSANLGFLWADLPLPEAIRAAGRAGFDAVECHWPYETPPGEVRAALAETGLRILALNTRRGGPGENGLAALPGREAEARASIDEALAYADAVGAGNVHVMAGFAAGAEARATFAGNLSHACAAAEALGIIILTEPLNRRDAPGYFLTATDQAVALMDDVGAANLKLMFDCYHVQIMEGDITRRLEALAPRIGHVQIAAVPDRGAPDHGELDFAHLVAHVATLDCPQVIGAEYRPAGPTEAGLGWLARLRAAG